MKKRLEKLEQDMREVGANLIRLTVFVNLLIERAGLTDAEVESAFQKANQEYAESESVRSSEAGADQHNPRRNTRLLGAPGNGDDSDRTSESAEDEEREGELYQGSSNGNQSSNDQSDQETGSRPETRDPKANLENNTEEGR